MGDLPAWATWLIAVVGVSGGLTIVWNKLKRLVAATNAWPVLMQIASQFEPNAGESLHDRIVHMESLLQEIEARLTAIEKVTNP